MRVIYSLCDYSGTWSQPYRDAGYIVHQIDLKHGHDVRLLEYCPERVHGILMAPDCNPFAGSGAQYWDDKDADGRTLAGISLVDACLRMVAIYQPQWWALENPVGRLRRWLGPPALSFDPCDYGGYGDESDAYTKRTLLWGKFRAPIRKPVPPIRACSQGSWIQTLGGSSERTKELRSVTPKGFAQAFFEANP